VCEYQRVNIGVNLGGVGLWVWAVAYECVVNSRSLSPPAISRIELRLTAVPSIFLQAFYKKPSLSTFEAWRMFVTEWKRGLEAHADPAEDVATELKRAAVRMRQENPKYVPREWMLVMCYDTAAKGDLGPLHSLHSLFETPYDEHPEMEAQFYRRAPEETLRKGGTAFMS
jgi:uncharacterized protein YdiU (UPF0061 family)